MRELPLDVKFDLETYRGLYKAQMYEHSMGRRKRPPSKRSVLADLEAAQAAAAPVAKPAKKKPAVKKAKKK